MLEVALCGLEAVESFSLLEIEKGVRRALGAGSDVLSAVSAEGYACT